MNKSKVNLIDIAKKAGVSISTVSLVLNNKNGVGNELSKKINEIALNMGYKQNKKNAKNKRIAFLKIERHGRIINETHNVFLADYIQGIINRSKALNYKLEISSYSKEQLNSIKLYVEKENYSGIIILATELYEEDIIFLSSINMPIVFLDAYYPYLKCHFVTMNNENSIFQLVEHLVELGHKRIGLVDSKSNASNLIIRRESFYKYLNYFNITFQDTDYFLVDSIYDKTVEDMGYYLSDNRDMPSALVCVNDTIAIGVIKALKNHNYNIPKDISVVGHDNLPTDLFIEPLLTTIDVPKIDIAQSAVDILDKEIRYRQKEHFKICAINGTLIPRESSDKLIDNKNSI